MQHIVRRSNTKTPLKRYPCFTPSLSSHRIFYRYVNANS